MDAPFEVFSITVVVVITCFPPGFTLYSKLHFSRLRQPKRIQLCHMVLKRLEKLAHPFQPAVDLLADVA